MWAAPIHRVNPKLSEWRKPTQHSGKQVGPGKITCLRLHGCAVTSCFVLPPWFSLSDGLAWNQSQVSPLFPLGLLWSRCFIVATGLLLEKWVVLPWTWPCAFLCLGLFYWQIVEDFGTLGQKSLWVLIVQWPFGRSLEDKYGKNNANNGEMFQRGTRIFCP